MDERLEITDESDDKKYFTITPRFVWALCSDPYELSFWIVVKDIAGDTGTCIISTPELAALAMMSTGKAQACRESLMNKGLLRGKLIKDPGYPQPVWHLTVPNLWRKNTDWCERNPKIAQRIAYKKSFHVVKALELAEELSPHEKGPPPHEKGPPPHETKKIIKEDQKEYPSIWEKVSEQLLCDLSLNGTSTLRGILEKAEAVDFQRNDNGNPFVLVVKLHDPFTLEWMRQRMTRKASQLAGGVVNHKVEVIFTA